MGILSTHTCRRTAALAGGAALALSGLAALPLMASSAQAAAPTVNSTTLYTASTTVTSSTGHKLKVSLSASEYRGSTKSIGVTLRTFSGNESHSWSFVAPDSAIYLSSTGTGTITLSATKMGGYGKMKLHVKPVAKAKTTSCQGQLVSKTRRVSVNGIFRFVTKSTGGQKWGAVGGSSFHFAAPSTVYWSYDNTASCPYPPYVAPCAAGSSWNVHSSGTKVYTSLSGGTFGTKSYIYGYRNVQLSKPSGARRFDYSNRSTKAARFSVAPGGVAHMRPTLGHGSADLASNNQSTYLNQCGTGSKSNKTTSWNPASYTNGPTPLKVPAQIYGALKVGNNADRGSFSRTVVVG